MSRLSFFQYPTIWLLLLLGTASAIAGWGVGKSVYRSATITWDESSYLFQSHIFSEGKLKRSAPALDEELDRGMIILSREAGWLSRYPFAHSLWLVPGVLLGAPKLMVGLAAVLSIIAMGAIGYGLGLRVMLLPWMLALSPTFLAMHGTLMSHTSGLTAVAGMLAAYIQWQRTRRWPYAVAAGLFWAWFFNNRTYTAALIVIPFALDAIFQIRSRNWKSYLPQVALFGASAMTGLLAFMIYNKISVGDWRVSTYLFYNPTHSLGFGPRDGRMIHTPALGLQNTIQNLRALDSWLYGFHYSLLVLPVCALIGLSRRWSFLFLSASLAIVAGYAAFWYPGVLYAGPVYYFEMLPFALAAAAIGINRILNRVPAKAVRPLSAAMILVAGMTGAQHLRSEYVRQGPVQALKRRVMDTVHRAPAHSVVIFEKLARDIIHECALNAQGVNSDPLILNRSVHLLNDQAPVYALLFPDRRIFKIIGRREHELRELSPELLKEAPLNVTLPMGMAHHRTGRNAVDNESGGLVRVAEDGDVAGWVFFGAFLRLVPGAYRAEFTYDLMACDASSPVSFLVNVPASEKKAAVHRVHGNHTNATTTVDFDLTEVSRIEPRVRYRGSGDLRLTHVRVSKRNVRAASARGHGGR